MPKIMRSRRRSRRPSRPFRRSGGQSTRAIAVRALQATDQEQKFLDNVFANNGIDDTSTTGSIFLLNGVSAGTANFNRIGKRMKMRSLYLQLAFNKDITAPTKTDYVRVIVLLDRQTNQALPFVDDVLILPGSGVPLTEMLSPNKLDNSKRFVTLYETRIALQKDFLEGRLLKKYIRLSQTVIYDNAGGIVADINTNSLVLMVIGSVVTGSSVPTFSGTVRLRFVG